MAARNVGFVVLLFTLILSGCQTLSKEECVAADWRVIGEQDGAAGHPPQQRFGDHAKSCEKAGVVPNQSLWNEGYQVGLKRFCTPLSGLAHGQKGGTYANTCPAEQASGFLSGYSVGKRQYDKKGEISSLQSRIRSAQSTISNNQSLMSQGKIDQFEAESTIRTNQRLVNDLNRELGRRESELYRINDEVADFRLSQEFNYTN